MKGLDVICKSFVSGKYGALKLVRKMPLLSISMFLALDFDTSVLFIVVILVGVVTFLAGTAYGIYLNDKISEKQVSNQ